MLLQNLYMLKLAWKISPRRVLTDFLLSGIDYFTRFFVSVTFIQIIVEAIEANREFSYIAVFLVIATAYFFLTSLFSIWYSERFVYMSDCYLHEKLNEQLFTQAANVELACFEDAEFYNAYTLAAQEANERLRSVLRNLSGIIFAAACMTAIFYAMFQIDRFVIIFAVFPIFATFVIAKKMNKNTYDINKSSTPHRRKLGYVDRVMYLKDYSIDIRLSNITNILHKYLSVSTQNIIGIIEKYKTQMSVLHTARKQLTFTLLYEGVVIYSAYMTLVRQTMTLGEFTILTAAMRTGVWTLIGLMEYISTAIENALFIQNYRTFMDYTPSIPENQNGKEPPQQFESLEFKNVYFKYRNTENNALQQITFKLTKGETIALVGHNGAGKTTLTKLMTRLYDPSDGEIMLNGVNIKDYRIKGYRSLFSSTCQDFKIFSMSVADNILMNAAYDSERLEDALKKSDAFGRVAALKDGVHTTLTREFDQNGAVLSGGEFQKIAIARAFARNFQIAVFDEPSSALDPMAEYHLFQSIKTHCQGKTLVFISHRLSSTIHADKIYVFENGQIIEAGNHNALMAQKGAYFNMFTKQAEKYLNDGKQVKSHEA